MQMNVKDHIDKLFVNNIQIYLEYIILNKR